MLECAHQAHSLNDASAKVENPDTARSSRRSVFSTGDTTRVNGCSFRSSQYARCVGTVLFKKKARDADEAVGFRFTETEFFVAIVNRSVRDSRRLSWTLGLRVSSCLS